MESPKISVIVPSFNQGEFISNVIKSVLGQTYSNWELIIQDGASSDNTDEVCSNFVKTDKRIIFNSEQDKGFADAVNKALNIATGELGVIQSSDDFFSNCDVFQDVINIFSNEKRLVLITGACVEVDKELCLLGIRELVNKYVPLENIFTHRDHFNQSASFFSIYRAKQIGKLDLNVDVVADTDFWVRLTCSSPTVINSVYQTSKIWGTVLVHENQRSNDFAQFYVGRAKMAVSHFKNQKLQFNSQFKFDHANNIILTGIEYFKELKRDLGELYFLYKELNDKEYILKVSFKRIIISKIKKMIRIIPFRKRISKKPVSGTMEYYSDKRRFPLYSIKWF